MLGQVAVVVMDGKENSYQRRHHENNNPGAIVKLGNGEDQHNRPRTNRAKTINPHF